MTDPRQLGGTPPAAGGPGPGPAAGGAPSGSEPPPPPGVDITRPSIARVYDAVLGGHDNYAVDRAVVEASLKIAPPSTLSAARLNREFLIRGVRYLAEQGVDQFLDIGSGLPTVQNTHQVAQAVNPDARVVYVDNDPIVLAHGQALLASNQSTTVVTADLLDPQGVLKHPEVEGFLDFSRPIALVLLGVVHYVLDEEDPLGVLNAYKERLAPGSHLFVSHFSSTFLPQAQEMEEALLRFLGRGKLRSQEEIAAFFDGFEMLEPGVVPVPRWRPDEPVAEPLDEGGLLVLGAMGRKA
ncbi:SAM-dependent methyltransferase [Streptomyces sp. 4N509B]|uniref:SAM-dependent methyltransferase n=1 Tax=Streptomyces sp. 4N509B TaxID=3457413 RepID=UPI003FD54213